MYPVMHKEELAGAVAQAVVIECCGSSGLTKSNRGNNRGRRAPKRNKGKQQRGRQARIIGVQERQPKGTHLKSRTTLGRKNWRAHAVLCEHEEASFVGPNAENSENEHGSDRGSNHDLKENIGRLHTQWGTWEWEMRERKRVGNIRPNTLTGSAVST